MAKSLQQARQETARDLEENLAEIRQKVPVEQEDDAAHLLWLDYRKLRGLPCLAKGVSGHPTDSWVPGSDEHLEEMTG